MGFYSCLVGGTLAFGGSCADLVLTVGWASADEAGLVLAGFHAFECAFASLDFGAAGGGAVANAEAAEGEFAAHVAGGS